MRIKILDKDNNGFNRFKIYDNENYLIGVTMPSKLFDFPKFEHVKVGESLIERLDFYRITNPTDNGKLIAVDLSDVFYRIKGYSDFGVSYGKYTLEDRGLWVVINDRGNIVSPRNIFASFKPFVAGDTILFTTKKNGIEKTYAVTENRCDELKK